MQLHHKACVQYQFPRISESRILNIKSYVDFPNGVVFTTVNVISNFFILILIPCVYQLQFPYILNLQTAEVVALTCLASRFPFRSSYTALVFTSILPTDNNPNSLNLVDGPCTNPNVHMN